MSFVIKEDSPQGTELVFRSHLDAQVLTNALIRHLPQALKDRECEQAVDKLHYPRWVTYDKAKIPVVGFVGNLEITMATPNVDVLTWPILTKVRSIQYQSVLFLIWYPFIPPNFSTFKFRNR